MHNIKAIFFGPSIPDEIQLSFVDHLSTSIELYHKCDTRDYLKRRQLAGYGPKEVLVIDNDLDGILFAVEARCRTWKFNTLGDLTVHNLEEVLHQYDNPL